MSGKSAVQYQVSPGGPVALNGVKSPFFGSANCSTALRALVTASSTQLLENEISRPNRGAGYDAGQSDICRLELDRRLSGNKTDNRNIFVQAGPMNALAFTH